MKTNIRYKSGVLTEAKTKSLTLDPVNLKAGEDDGLQAGQFEAYASVFDNIDSYGEIVTKGAFAATLGRWAEKGKPIPLLFGHNFDDPEFNIGYVVKAWEDDHGLRVLCQLDLDSAKGAHVYRMLKDGRVDQMSFAFEVLEYEEQDDVTYLKEVELFEVSVVTLGANRATEILGVKAGRAVSRKNRSVLERALTAVQDAAAAIQEVLDSDGAEEEPEGEEEKTSVTQGSAKVAGAAEEPTGAADGETEEKTVDDLELYSRKFRLL